MTDQQDLRARLLAEADRLDSWEFDHPDHYPVTAVALLREAAAQLPAGVPEFTTGHCANKKAPGGCKLHNLQCGYPECDKRASTPQPDNAAPGGRIDPNDGAFAGTACRMAAQIGVAYGAKEKCQIGAPFFAFTVTELVNFARAIAAISAPKEDSAAPGGDVETRGHIAMLRSLRLMYEDGVMGEGDHVGTISALDAAIAALSVPTPDGDVERLREALENLISVAEPMAAEDGKCPPIREPNERGGTTVTIDPFPLLKYRVEDMDDLREGIKSARAIIAALSAPKQVGGLPDAVLLDRGFQIKDGVVTPTLLFGFNPDDWAARDRFAAMINTSPQAAPVPVEGDGRRFRGVGHLEETGYIDPPSQPAVELERNEAAKLAKGLRESAIAMRALHGGIYAKWNDRADECDKAAALIDGAKAGRG